MTVKTYPVAVHLSRPEACRLYGLIGHALWLESVINSLPPSEVPSQFEVAARAFATNLVKETGVKRLNQIQDNIFKELG